MLEINQLIGFGSASEATIISRTFVGTTTASTNPSGLDTSKTISFGVNPTAGDLIVVMTIMGSGIAAGYTQYGGNFNDTNNGYVHRLYVRVSDGTETSVSANCTAAQAVIFRGVTYKAVGGWAEIKTGTTLTISPNASTVAGNTVVYLVNDRNASGTGYTASGLTSAYHGDSVYFTAAYGYILSCSGNSNIVVAVSTGCTAGVVGIAITLS